jgi:hypothetical protein
MIKIVLGWMVLVVGVVLDVPRICPIDLINFLNVWSPPSIRRIDCQVSALEKGGSNATFFFARSARCRCAYLPALACFEPLIGGIRLIFYPGDDLPRVESYRYACAVQCMLLRSPFGTLDRCAF